MKIRALILGVMVVSFALAWYFLIRKEEPPPPEIPSIVLDDVGEATADAVNKAIAAVRRDPRSGKAWGRLGMVLHANGFIDHVGASYENASRFDPSNPAWPYLHGRFLLTSNPNQAAPLLQKALKLTQNIEEQATIHFQLAMLFAEEGRLGEAEAHLQALRQIQANDPRAIFVMALVAIARNEREAARNHLSALITNPFAQKRAHILLASLVDRENSRKFQQQAERLAPDSPWPDPFEQSMQSHRVDRMERIGEFRNLQAQGRHAEALAFLRRFASDHPDGEVCFLLAFELLKTGQFAEAEKSFRDAIRFEPTNTKSHLMLAECLLQRAEKSVKSGDKNAADELFRQALVSADNTLALQRDLGLAHLARARALRNLNRKDDAIEAAKLAALAQPESSTVHLLLGELLAESGQLEQGIVHLQYAVDFASPADEAPREALRRWQSKIKKLPPAKP